MEPSIWFVASDVNSLAKESDTFATSTTASVILDNLTKVNKMLLKTASVTSAALPRSATTLLDPDALLINGHPIVSNHISNNEDSPTNLGAILNGSFANLSSLNETDFLNQSFHLPDMFGPKRDPMLIVIPITVIYLLIFISGVIGNISTCIVISKNRSMHTATNYYLFSLAISDFLLLISGVPQEMYYIWSRYPYVFGEVFCVLRGLAAETSANATVLTITAFTVERYVAICHPFLSHTMSRLSRAVRLIILVWLISLMTAIPQALQFGIINNYGVDQCGVTRIIIEHSFELSTFLFFFAPMTLITVLYVLIGLKLRSSSLMKRENGNSWHRRVHINSCRQQTSQGTRRVLKMLVAVVVAFFICWAPFHAQRLVAIYGAGIEPNSNPVMLKIYVIMTYISGILYYLSTCINPLLYNIMSNKFREAFKATLAKCLGLAGERNDQKRSYRILSRAQRRRHRAQESTDCSGNSVRDESCYSTSTQNQSIESVTVSRGCSLGHRHYFVSVESETDPNLFSSIGLEVFATPIQGDDKQQQQLKYNNPATETNLILEIPDLNNNHPNYNNNSSFPFSQSHLPNDNNNSINHQQLNRFPFYRRAPLLAACQQHLKSDRERTPQFVGQNGNVITLSAPQWTLYKYEDCPEKTNPIPGVFENELDSYMEEIKMREKR